MISISDEDKQEFGSDLPLKNVRKLSAFGTYLLDKAPGLSRYYMSIAQSTSDNVTTSSTNNTPDSRPTNRMCECCGAVFTGHNCRVRHYAKKTPSSGRWANLLAREPDPRWSANTRKRVQKLRNARTRTVTTCLTCGKSAHTLGAKRMSRDERRVTSEPEMTSKKRKRKRKRQKEVNAGLKIGEPLLSSDADSMSCDSPFSMPSSPQSKSQTSSPRHEVDTMELSQKLAKRDSSKVKNSNNSVRRETQIQTESEQSSHKKTKRGKALIQSMEVLNNKSKSDVRKNSWKTKVNTQIDKEMERTKKSKKKKKMNQLSTLLANETKKKGGSSLTDFLKQV